MAVGRLGISGMGSLMVERGRTRSLVLPPCKMLGGDETPWRQVLFKSATASISRYGNIMN